VLAELVTRWRGEQPLRPIARLATTRRVRRLTGPDGQMLAEIADDLVTGSVPAVAGEPDLGSAAAQRSGLPPWRVVSRWREVEVELGTGTRGLLDAAGDLLLRAGAERSASASKLSRLLAAAAPAGQAEPARRGNRAGRDHRGPHGADPAG
jgi:hypothetical protein